MLKNLGVGIDIVDVCRFKKMPYKSNIQFYKKIFHPSEIKYCLRHKDSAPHFAAKFAIKEAVIKSIPFKVSFHDIITGHKNSKPIVTIKTDTKYEIKISVSHEKKYAIAIAIAISEKTK